MDTFAWDQRFVTGLPEFDAQHHRLVELINRLGQTRQAGAAIPDAEVAGVVGELTDYARHHFADEERLMAETGVDERHAGPHRRHHQSFIEQVALMGRTYGPAGPTANVGGALHGFLVSWLAFHILGEDQALARQITRIREGKTAHEAFDSEAAPADAGTAALLQALHSLYGVIVTQNRELAQANALLEEAVAARTRQLTEANERLAREQSDLTELLSKVEEAQGQVLQSEKMAAIGQLAAGVAHEINNPVGFVSSNLGTLKGYVQKLLSVLDTYHLASAQLPPEERERIAGACAAADLDYLRQDVVDLLRESEDGIARVRKIVRDLKEFSHVDESEIQEADLNAGMESTLNVVWNELKYKADVIRDYGDLPRVRCLPAQINQVFMNLLVNAGQAIAERGIITIRSGIDNDRVWMEVADTGAGMSPEVRRRIFEPFFTTKPVGKGTGLGLSLSYDIIVKKHGGRIDVASEPGRGTTFRVWLPVTAALTVDNGGGGDG